MMKNRRPMTREQYNREVIWTGESEETAWYDKFAEELKAADIADSDRDEITEMLEQKYKFDKLIDMTFSDHYLNDKIIKESSEYTLQEAKQRQIYVKAAAAQQAQDAEDAQLLAQQQAQQQQEALEAAQKEKEFEARVDASLAKRLADLGQQLRPDQQALLQQLLADTPVRAPPLTSVTLTPGPPGTPVRVQVQAKRNPRPRSEGLPGIEELTETSPPAVGSSSAPTPVRPRATTASSSAALVLPETATLPTVSSPTEGTLFPRQGPLSPGGGEMVMQRDAQGRFSRLVRLRPNTDRDGRDGS